MAHGDPEDLDRIHVRPRRQPAVHAHLDLDRAQHRRRLDGRELVGVLPLGGATVRSEPVPEGDVVELGHDPVHLEGDRVPPRLHLGLIGEAALDPRHGPVLDRRREAPPGQHLQPLRVGVRQLDPFGSHHRVGVELERIPLHLGGVVPAERAGGRVARVREDRVAVRLAPRVESLEPFPRDEHLAPDLHEGRRRLDVEPQRHVPDRGEIRRDVLTHSAVATGESLTQHAVHVDERRRDAVELRLDVPDELLALLEPEEAVDLGREVPGLVLGAEALDRQHRNHVPHLLEAAAFGERCPHPPGRAVDRSQLRMLLLERLQLAEERVVLGVGDLGPALVVVDEVVPPDLGAQSLGPARLLGPPGVFGLLGAHGRCIAALGRARGPSSVRTRGSHVHQRDRGEDREGQTRGQEGRHAGHERRSHGRPDARRDRR